jgi:hypothetical protein
MGNRTVRKAMDDHPMTCTPETELDEVRRMMLERHTRYMPVMDNRMLMGVISFYDVAKAVVDSQNFENKMLKAYIRDWPRGLDEVAGRIDLEQAHAFATDLPAEDQRHIEFHARVLERGGVAVIHMAHGAAQHARGIEHALGVPDGDGRVVRRSRPAARPAGSRAPTAKCPGCRRTAAP